MLFRENTSKKKQNQTTEEDLQKYAYTSDVLDASIVEKLNVGPNYVRMCVSCTNAATFMHVKMKREVPEQGKFPKTGIAFPSLLQNWPFQNIHFLDEPGYKDEYHQMLFLTVPHGNGSDMEMSVCLCSGTKKEILEFLDTPECGPRIMKALDEMAEAIKGHH